MLLLGQNGLADVRDLAIAAFCPDTLPRLPQNLLLQPLLRQKLRLLQGKVLNLLLLVHCETLAEVDDLLQLVDHLVGEDLDAAVHHIIDISGCLRPALSIDDGSDGEEPVDELFTLLKVREPLVHLVFLVGAEQEDRLVVEVDLDCRAYLVLSHLYARRRSPNAHNLAHFEDLSIL